MVTNEFATGVATRLTKEGQAFDPSIIPVIIEIVFELVKMFQNCNKGPNEALMVARSPNFWERIAVRVAAVRVMGRHEFMRAGGYKVVDALIAEGKTLSQDKIVALFSDA